MVHSTPYISDFRSAPPFQPKMPTPPPPPINHTYTYSYTPHLTPYTLPLLTFLTSTTHNPNQTTHIVTGALIFSTQQSHTPRSPELNEGTALGTGALIFHPQSQNKSQPGTETQPPKILLLRRAPTDSFPGHWEAPGGSCDETDASILSGAAREVFEETGLRVSRFVELVGVDEWTVVRGGGVKRVVKFSFLVEVEAEEGKGKLDGAIRLDPAEHDAFVWATEEEVRQGVVVVYGMKMGVRFVGRQRENYLRGFEVVRSLSN
ncbi:NUDIX hydrolase [Aspergillus saccharolyticus JOP 1030-1]|uniref:NUDIX-domain-containing protein n=1 Tax=Aspergillus saccharolyticus JOP 1030-1 TaxID=1450539 RepID=A0A319A105_9EURO|nr:NUDIX-domain-containing protein [Aspergillus saccharolyticus JOP 1030-1]PYH45978.1 NUDIX-domain-containing protein [Aspergillus saccharolyticus JOP 1030-1]